MKEGNFVYDVVLADLKRREAEILASIPDSCKRSQDTAGSMSVEDRAAMVTNEVCSGGLAKKINRDLFQIRQALTRLEAGKYGVCLCGDDISEKRLKAIPWAVDCIDCAEAASDRKAIRTAGRPISSRRAVNTSYN